MNSTPRALRYAFYSTAPLAVFGGLLLSYVHFNGAVSVAMPHSYASAKKVVLELTSLVIAEAERGEKAFFLTHVGCATPTVWQDPEILTNLARMVKAGVEVKLIAGRIGSNGQEHSTDWPGEFATKFGTYDQPYKIKSSSVYTLIKQELPCHSIVAGSDRAAVAYICPPRPDDTYPSEYFEVRDPAFCQAWKAYLASEFEKGKAKHGK